MRREAGVPFWLCVGDLGGDEGRYENPPAPLYWIKGNNEDFDVVARAAAGDARFPNLHYVANGSAIEIEGLRVAGLGGTYAPTWYETPASALPCPGSRPAGPPRRAWLDRDKRRHFVREEVEACCRIRGPDVLLTHEAPKPFFVGFDRAPGGGRRRGMDAGKAPINEVLRRAAPRLHLFGHHHRFDERVCEGVPSICLDPIGVSYLLIDHDTLGVRRVPVER
jgi:hypothetical protein